MEAAIEVTVVETLDDRTSFHWSLDLPQPGATSEGYTLNLAGWVISGGAEPCAVELGAGGEAPRRVSADGDRPDVARDFPDEPNAARSGFVMTVDLLQVAPTFALEVTAITADGAAVPLARVHGRRVPLPPAPDDHLQPITVLAHGRSGTQWLVRLAGSHPEIVAHRPFDLEPRVIVYWLSVLRDVADPASQTEMLARTGTDRHFWLGEGARPEGVFYIDGDIRTEIGRCAVDELAGFAARRVEQFYRAAAGLHGPSRPRFFVEKSTGRDYALLRLQRELYPAGREIVLVRDFRDTFASMLAFNIKRDQQGFERHRFQSDDQYLTHFRDATRMLLDHYRSRAGASRMVRYEDLILEPEETLAGVLEWIGVDASPGTVAEMLATASVDTPQMRNHRTAPDVPRSIGRWKRDLPLGLREQSCALLEDDLLECGYEL